jgi:hypothetical protein
MADRNAPASFTFEQWRVEFNELASDVGDIGNLGTTGALSGTTDLIEAVNAINSSLSGQDLDFQADTGGALNIDLDTEVLSITGGTNIATVGSGNQVTINLDTIASGGITFEGATVDGFETTLDVEDPTADRTVTIPNENGVLSTQGFSLAISVALG